MFDRLQFKLPSHVMPQPEALSCASGRSGYAGWVRRGAHGGNRWRTRYQQQAVYLGQVLRAGCEVFFFFVAACLALTRCCRGREGQLGCGNDLRSSPVAWRSRCVRALSGPSGIMRRVN